MGMGVFSLTRLRLRFLRDRLGRVCSLLSSKRPHGDYMYSNYRWTIQTSLLFHSSPCLAN